MCRVERGTKEQKRIEPVHSPHGRDLVPEEPDVDLDCDEHEHQTGPPGRPPNPRKNDTMSNSNASAGITIIPLMA
jgi:hypothetical protein